MHRTATPLRPPHIDRAHRPREAVRTHKEPPMPSHTTPTSNRPMPPLGSRPSGTVSSATIKQVGRAGAACAISVGLLGAGVLPAANATTQDYYQYGYAWVKVCQYVKYHDTYQHYSGSYHVDSYYDRDAESDEDWELTVNGWNKCHGKIKVKVGYIKVTVDEAPEGVEDDYDDSVTFKVRKDRSYT